MKALTDLINFGKVKQNLTELLDAEDKGPNTLPWLL